jgi:hypothetical protein
MKCGSRSLQWVPRGGHPLKNLRRYDAIMRSLAETYGLSNMRSARAGEAVVPPPPDPMPTGQKWSPMPGVELPLRYGCQNIDAKTVAPLLDAMPAESQPKVPHISERTIISARYTRDGKEMPPV